MPTEGLKTAELWYILYADYPTRSMDKWKKLIPSQFLRKKEVLQYKQVSFQLKKKTLKQDNRFHIHTYMYETHQIKSFPLMSIVPRKL